MNLYRANEVYVSATEQFVKEFQEALDYAKTNLAIYFPPFSLKFDLNEPLPPHLSVLFVDVDVDVDVDVGVGVGVNYEKLKQMKLQQRQQQVEVKQILKMVDNLLSPYTKSVSYYMEDIMSTIRCYVNKVNIALESYRNKFDAVAPDCGTRDDCVPMFQQLHAPDCDLGQRTSGE